ncbi:hypothetical protein AVEN_213575-1, partial [Araneus ventricosus]
LDNIKLEPIEPAEENRLIQLSSALTSLSCEKSPEFPGVLPIGNSSPFQKENQVAVQDNHLSNACIEGLLTKHTLPPILRKGKKRKLNQPLADCSNLIRSDMGLTTYPQYPVYKPSSEICDNFASLDPSLDLDYAKAAEALIQFQDSKTMDMIDIESIISALPVNNNQISEVFRNSNFQDLYCNVLQSSLFPSDNTDVNNLTSKSNLFSNSQSSNLSIMQDNQLYQGVPNSMLLSELAATNSSLPSNENLLNTPKQIYFESSPRTPTPIKKVLADIDPSTFQNINTFGDLDEFIKNEVQDNCDAIQDYGICDSNIINNFSPNLNRMDKLGNELWCSPSQNAPTSYECLSSSDSTITAHSGSPYQYESGLQSVYMPFMPNHSNLSFNSTEKQDADWHAIAFGKTPDQTELTCQAHSLMNQVNQYEINDFSVFSPFPPYRFQYPCM